MRSKKKKKVRLNLKRFIPFLLIVAIVIVGLNTVLAKEVLPGPDVIYAPQEETVDLSIRCVGDIMCHSPQLAAAANRDGSYYKTEAVGSSTRITTDSTFDFLCNYEYVKQYLEEADLTLANFEVTFGGDDTFAGYPGFDSPDILASQVASCGVDVALFANNHMLDSKLAGAKRTVQVLRDAGMTAVGARTDTSENRSVIVDVKGVKVGVVAYTYETPTVNGQRSMNGSTASGMNSGAPDYINTFRYDGSGIKQADLDSIKAELSWCRENGADIVICYLHWGNEYQLKPSKNDKALAQFVAENGADIIFASHPHVLQGISYIEVEEEYPLEWSSEVYPRYGEMPERSGLQEFKLKIGRASEEELAPLETVTRPTTWTKTVPVYYSMGNFVSNQRSETLSGTYGADSARRTEQGMIACVELTYNKANGNIMINEQDCIPTWVDKYTENGKVQYRIIPLIGDLSANPTLKTSGHLTRAKSALEEITNFLGAEYVKSN